jgi:flagellar biosynthetic protein FliR
MVQEIQHILLILIRISFFIAICPGFSYSAFPNSAKVALSLGLAIAVSSFVSPIVGDNLWLFFLVGLKEMFIGIALGYITVLFFTGIEMAGNLVDFQVGFSMGAIYDPGLGVQVSNYGRVYYWIALALFFLTNVHHLVLESLIRSYTYIPLNEVALNDFAAEGMVKLFAHVFEIALLLAIPLIIVALLSELTLALISRTVPQINVLILGMPMKTLVSIVFMFFFLSTLMRNIGNVFPDMIRYMEEFIQSISL